MTVALTYLGFHLVFVLPALAATASTATYPTADPKSAWTGIGVVALVALAYTAPWDNYLIARGVWHYGPGTVTATVRHAPVAEYLFVLLQPAITGAWLCRWRPATTTVDPPSRLSRAAAVAAGLGVGAAGLVLLAAESTFYLGAILAWAGPVLAVQWGFGPRYLWANRRTVAVGVAVPTLYLCAADRVAIELGVWQLSARYTTGIAVAGLPVEEGAFFLLTNLFVVQGLLLYLWVSRRWR